MRYDLDEEGDRLGRRMEAMQMAHRQAKDGEAAMRSVRSEARDTILISVLEGEFNFMAMKNLRSVRYDLGKAMRMLYWGLRVIQKTQGRAKTLRAMQKAHSHAKDLQPSRGGGSWR